MPEMKEVTVPIRMVFILPAFVAEWVTGESPDVIEWHAVVVAESLSDAEHQVRNDFAGEHPGLIMEELSIYPVDLTQSGTYFQTQPELAGTVS